MKQRPLDFKVDKLTNSIEHVLTGEIFETEIVRLTIEDLSGLRTLHWAFDWALELTEPGHEVHALLKKIDPSEWQALVSFTEKEDPLFMNLLENAPFNKGREKRYVVWRQIWWHSFVKYRLKEGLVGNIVFEAKTRLIAHYEKTLRAQRFSHHRMFITAGNAYHLVQQYFPDFRP